MNPLLRVRISNRKECRKKCRFNVIFKEKSLLDHSAVGSMEDRAALFIYIGKRGPFGFGMRLNREISHYFPMLLFSKNSILMHLFSALCSCVGFKAVLSGDRLQRADTQYFI